MTTTTNAVIATYSNEHDLTEAVKHLKRREYDMSMISVLGKGLSEERHIVGFETSASHTKLWAKFGGMWGWLFGAFVFVPGFGHLAIGGYLLYLITTIGLGAAGGALAGLMSGMNIPDDGIPQYETALRAEKILLIAHGDAASVERAREILAQTTHEQIDVHGPPAVMMARVSS